MVVVEGKQQRCGCSVGWGKRWKYGDGGGGGWKTVEMWGGGGGGGGGEKLLFLEEKKFFLIFLRSYESKPLFDVM